MHPQRRVRIHVQVQVQLRPRATRSGPAIAGTGTGKRLQRSVCYACTAHVPGFYLFACALRRRTLVRRSRLLPAPRALGPA